MTYVIKIYIIKNVIGHNQVILLKKIRNIYLHYFFIANLKETSHIIIKEI